MTAGNSHVSFLDVLRLAGEDYRLRSEADERELVAQLREYEAGKQKTQTNS